MYLIYVNRIIVILLLSIIPNGAFADARSTGELIFRTFSKLDKLVSHLDWLDREDRAIIDEYQALKDNDVFNLKRKQIKKYLTSIANKLIKRLNVKLKSEMHKHESDLFDIKRLTANMMQLSDSDLSEFASSSSSFRFSSEDTYSSSSSSMSVSSDSDRDLLHPSNSMLSSSECSDADLSRGPASEKLVKLSKDVSSCVEKVKQEGDQIQRKIWNLMKQGKYKQGKQLELETHKLLSKSGNIISCTPMDEGSVEKYKVTYDNGLQGIFKPDVPNSPAGSHYKHEIAAYKIDRDLDVGLVPMTVELETHGDHGCPKAIGSLQLWMGDAKSGVKSRVLYPGAMSETSFSNRSSNLLAFEFLTNNCDAHDDNFMISKSTGATYAIDNGAAFAPTSSRKIHGCVIWKEFIKRGPRSFIPDDKFIEALRTQFTDEMIEARYRSLLTIPSTKKSAEEIRDLADRKIKAIKENRDILLSIIDSPVYNPVKKSAGDKRKSFFSRGIGKKQTQ